jgi:hypothetical protein
VEHVFWDTPPGNNMDFRNGLAFYGLDRDHPGNNWSEATITYSNAPGMASDGNMDSRRHPRLSPRDRAGTTTKFPSLLGSG